MRSNMKRILVFMLFAIMLVSSGSCGLRTVEESDVSNPSDASDVSLPPVPIPETPVVLLMDNAYYGGVDEYIPMELGNYEIAYIEEECVGTTHTVTVFGIEFVGNYYATRKLLNTKTELRWYDNVGVKDREYSFNFQIEKETGKLISLTFSATPHPREHNLLHENRKQKAGNNWHRTRLLPYGFPSNVSRLVCPYRPSRHNGILSREELLIM